MNDVTHILSQIESGEVQLWASKNFSGVLHLSRFGACLYWVDLTKKNVVSAPIFVIDSRRSRWRVTISSGW